MSREIRFRAWNRAATLMFQVNDLGGLMQHTNVSCKHGSACPEMEGLDEGWLDEVELMQYTGLKDRNGVEIYEGDLIKGFHYDEEAVRPVFWSARHATWGTGYDNGEHRNYTSLSIVSEPQVIGNIYENPELLS